MTNLAAVPKRVRKKQMAKYTRRVPTLKQGRWSHDEVTTEVRVLAVAEGYAMVRRKGTGPFVVSVKELEMV